MSLHSAGRFKRVRTRVFRLGACLALIVSSGVAVADAAQSATTNVGTLTFSPATGLASDPVDLTTVSKGPNTGCPTGSGSARGIINGPGQWINIPLIGTDTSNVSTTGEFHEPLGDTLGGIAAANSLSILVGKYDISLICQDADGVATFGSFDSSIWFTSATQFQSTDPAVQVASTTTVVSASPVSPQALGTSVTFTAMVSPTSAAGSVQFKDGNTSLGSAEAVSGGHATYATNALTAATHSISAVFTPSTNAYSASMATAISYVISNPSATSTATLVTSNPVSPVVAGAPVTFTATVTPTAAGSVQFKDNGVNLDSVQTVSGGHALLTTSALTAGVHSITAAFAPTDTAAFNGSLSSALPFTVSPGTVQVTATALAADPVSPSAVGGPVVFTATVTPTGAAGSVQFKDGSSNLSGAQPLSGGKATLSISSLAGGSHQIIAAFTPTDAGVYAASTSPAATYVIAGNLMATTTALSSNPGSPAASGTPVTFLASVNPVVAGTLQFKDGGVALGAAQAVVSGAASTSTSTLSSGSHDITAVFTPADAATYAGSTSTAITFVVTAPTGSNLGTLTFNPETGQDSDPLLIMTHSAGAHPGCPTAAGSARAVVNGPGWSDIPAIGTTTADFSNTADFSLTVGDTFTGLAATNQLTIVAGEYDFTLYCQDVDGVNVLGTFTGSIWFTDPTHFQSTNPAGSTTTTTTSLVVGPDGRQDLGKAVTVAAAVAPANAVGAVQFKDTVSGVTVNLGMPVTLTGGAGQLVTSTLPFGMHTFTVTFTPADATKFKASESGSVVYVVALPVPPKLMVAAHIDGPLRVGGVLGCFATYKLGTSYAYTWYRNGRAIAGAVRSTYRLAAQDFLRTIACRMTARNLGGSTPSMSRTVAYGLQFKMRAAPYIRGSHQIGKTLLAIPGTWSPKPQSYSYIWLRDGKAIAGATKQGYRVAQADMGHKLTANVTVKATFYSLVTQATRPI
jgi:hypothetical protein